MGLQILYPSKGSKNVKVLKADVVAVHGLNGNPERTWKHQMTEAFWLKDFLPNDVPDVRVMTFGYNADAAFGNTTADIVDHAKDLLSSLVDKRERDNELFRPIIFIGHSLGGIVIKQALFQARIEQRYNNIRKSTTGIIFLGTPHRGSEKAAYGKVLATVATAVLNSPPPRLVKALKTNSDSLTRLTTDFRFQLSDYQVYSFYEMKPMKKWMLSTLIVEKHSAVLDTPGEEQIPVDANHEEMCKFPERDDEVYQKLLKRIHRTIRGQDCNPLQSSPIYGPAAGAASHRQHYYYHPNNQICSSGPPEQTQPSHESTIPFCQDRDYVHRGDILDQIDRKCSAPAARVALVGLGGVGKSQVAIHYAYQIRRKLPQMWVFWVYASTRAKFEEGYKNIADRLELRGRDDLEANILQLVKKWLCAEKNGPWFMIVDNADDAATFFGQNVRNQLHQPATQAITAPSIASFLPQTQNGCILFTSRSEDVASRLTGNHKNIIRLGPMDRGEGLDLLERKLNSHFEQDAALELLQALDCMPLAITQAAAYLSRLGPRGSIPKYLELFSKSNETKTRLLNTDTGDLRREEHASNSIIVTWQISFYQIYKERPSAAGLLSVMSFFDRQGIPESVLRSYAQTQRVGNSDADPELEFEEDLAVLKGYCLVNQEIEGHAFNMHRLVQFATRRWLEASNDLDSWRLKFLIILSAELPLGESPPWSKGQIMFPHAEAAAMDEPADEKSLLYWIQVLNNAGWYACARGRYKVAESMARKAAIATEKVYGRDDPYTLRAMELLARVLLNDGQYQEAEEIYRRALDRCKMLGEDHPTIPRVMGDLALALQCQGNYHAAEEINKKALDRLENGTTKDFLASLTIKNNMAALLRNQGNYEAAEEIIKQELDACEKVIGKEHPALLRCVEHLAWALQDRGNYQAAEELTRQALTRFEKVLGKDHPALLTTFFCLLSVLGYQGKHQVAEEICRRILDVCEKTFEKDHPTTINYLGYFAVVLRHRGKYKEAEETDRRVLGEKEKRLGNEHPDTLRSVANLAHVLAMRKEYNSAVDFYERAYIGFEKVLGPDHPQTVACHRCYSSTRQEMAISAYGNTYRLRQLGWIIRGPTGFTAGKSSSRTHMLMQHFQQLAKQRGELGLTWRRIPKLPPAFECELRDRPLEL